MPRKQEHEFEMLLPGMEEDEPPVPRSRKSKPAPAPRPARRNWLVLAVIVVFLIAGYYGFQQIERLLIRDPRFILAEPEPGEESTGVTLHGVSRAARSSILRIFDPDYGRSIYLMPIAERRRRLLAVDWVRDASVSRIWPNRVAVRITEREPVAFIRLSTGDSAAPHRFALIDADGVILEPQARARYQLPVLTGIRREQSEAVRRDRVLRAMKLLRDLGKLSEHVSEIDVSDPENLKITQQIDSRAIVLVLGNQRYRQRLEAFLSHYDDIRRRLGDATALDLRLEDRITALKGAPGEQ